MFFLGFAIVACTWVFMVLSWLTMAFSFVKPFLPRDKYSSFGEELALWWLCMAPTAAVCAIPLTYAVLWENYFLSSYGFADLPHALF